MPRIPTRTTPYDTPTRQHRHFKNKRDQVLRALGRSSYINGSQFAIMWVSARGETETYASPVLQGLLESEPSQPGLFSPEILQRAKEAALKAPPELKVSEICLEHIRKAQPSADAPPAASPIESDSRSALSGKGTAASSSPDGPPGTAEAETSTFERPLSEEGPVPPSSTSDCSMDEPSSLTVGDSTVSSQLNTQSDTRLSPKNHHLTLPADLSFSAGSPVCSGAREEGARYPSQDDSKGFSQTSGMSNTGLNLTSSERRSAEGNRLNYMSHNDILSIASESENQNPFEVLHQEAVCAETKDQQFNPNLQPIEFLPIQEKPSTTTENSTIISFSSPLSIASFLENKFRQLQQNTCKLVCKAWIKVVEPKKQRKSGETSKPDWWPGGVVHREPDHLLKPDRIKLMLAVLGAGKVPVGRLELASAEMAAFIPPDKMDILKDIYTVAKEEERLRSTWPVGVTFVPFHVELSNTTCEAPSKSSSSPQTMNSEILTASPTTIHYLPNVQSASELTLNFMGTVPSGAHIQEKWPPCALPGYVNNTHPQSFNHGKPNGFLPVEYHAYADDVMADGHKSWAMNSYIFQEGVAGSNRAKRSGRPGQNLLDNMELINHEGITATNGYNFSHASQSSLTSELCATSTHMEGGSSKESGSNPPIHDASFFHEFSTPENTGWGNCGIFFENGVGNDCTQNLWSNVTIPSAPFENSKVLSDESYLV
ncbi:hypothetical protein PSHT_00251 [Puccinia striiformis]|uniref:Subtelomeric hrmA-associated cluster protein AFUB-079030/YDR124W-like helical bundle domain-containing protein n=2 Tax=Puccinia striiformis TaxID=27350 RepID=A0A2S4WNN4_9BASI|nr:hypothetical protein PSTT_11833 [Puccinia striiformis]POW23386.1 hypothetical protein PSHT_00251 [Puccinia striiformis]